MSIKSRIKKLESKKTNLPPIFFIHIIDGFYCVNDKKFNKKEYNKWLTTIPKDSVLLIDDFNKW